MTPQEKESADGPQARGQALLDEEYAVLLHGGEPDAVEETIARYSAESPDFSALMEEARSRRLPPTA